MNNPTIGKVFEITDDYLMEGKQCYEIRVNTACCKGLYDLCLEGEEWKYLQSGEKCLPGVVRMLKEELKRYERRKI